MKFRWAERCARSYKLLSCVVAALLCATLLQQPSPASAEDKVTLLFANDFEAYLTEVRTNGAFQRVIEHHYNPVYFDYAVPNLLGGISLYSEREFHLTLNQAVTEATGGTLKPLSVPSSPSYDPGPLSGLMDHPVIDFNNDGSIYWASFDGLYRSASDGTNPRRLVATSLAADVIARGDYRLLSFELNSPARTGYLLNRVSQTIHSITVDAGTEIAAPPVVYTHSPAGGAEMARIALNAGLGILYIGMSDGSVRTLNLAAPTSLTSLVAAQAPFQQIESLYFDGGDNMLVLERSSGSGEVRLDLVNLGSVTPQFQPVSIPDSLPCTRANGSEVLGYDPDSNRLWLRCGSAVWQRRLQPQSSPATLITAENPPGVELPDPLLAAPLYSGFTTEILNAGDGKSVITANAVTQVLSQSDLESAVIKEIASGIGISFLGAGGLRLGDLSRVGDEVYQIQGDNIIARSLGGASQRSLLPAGNTLLMESPSFVVDADRSRVFFYSTADRTVYAVDVVTGVPSPFYQFPLGAGDCKPSNLQLSLDPEVSSLMAVYRLDGPGGCGATPYGFVSLNSTSGAPTVGPVALPIASTGAYFDSHTDVGSDTIFVIADPNALYTVSYSGEVQAQPLSGFDFKGIQLNLFLHRNIVKLAVEANLGGGGMGDPTSPTGGDSPTTVPGAGNDTPSSPPSLPTLFGLMSGITCTHPVEVVQFETDSNDALLRLIQDAEGVQSIFSAAELTGDTRQKRKQRRRKKRLLKSSKKIIRSLTRGNKRIVRVLRGDIADPVIQRRCLRHRKGQLVGVTRLERILGQMQ